MIFLDLHGTEFGNLSEVVSPEIDEHVVLSEFLRIDEKFCFQAVVLFLRLSARPGAGEREGVKNAVLKFCECLGRGTGHFHVGAGEVEHVRGRVQCAEHPVSIEKGTFKICLEAVG